MAFWMWPGMMPQGMMPAPRRRRRGPRGDGSAAEKSDAFVYLLGDESFGQPVACPEKGRMRNAAGLNVRTRRWGVEDPKALMVLLHGYLHRMDPFHDHLAGQLNRRGISVAGLDFPGHGESGGVKALVPYLTYLAADVIQLTRKQPEASRRIPIFLMAHSMGAAVALFAAEREPRLFAGVVMTAPMLGLEALASWRVGSMSVADPSKCPDEFTKQAMAMWASMDPTAPVLPGAENMAECARRHYDVQTDCCSAGADQPSLVRAGIPLPCPCSAFKDKGYFTEGVMRDPYGYTGGMRVGTGLALMDAAAKFERGFGFVNLPFLVAHGTNDRITDPEKSRLLYDTAPSRDKTFLEFEDASHGLWWEPQDTRRKLLDDILTWLQDHIEAPGNEIDQTRHLRRPVGTEDFIPSR